MGGCSSSPDSGYLDNQKVVGFLNRVPVLSKLNGSQRARLAEAMITLTYYQHDYVFEEGDEGTAFYIVLSGACRVVRDGAELAVLNVGDYFGETALLTDAPRGASIITSSRQMDVLSMEKREFEDLFGSEINVKLVKRGGIIAGHSQTKHMDVPPLDSPIAPADAEREKDESVREAIFAIVDENVLFSGFNREHKYEVIDQMYRQEVAAGTVLLKEGDMGSNVFFIEEGRLEVNSDGEEKIRDLTSGQLFGERALLYNNPRSATVTAVEDSVLWKIDRFTFRRIGMDLGKKEMSKYAEFLEQVELLGALTSLERAKIAEALETVEFHSNEIIFKEDDIGDAMYIISSGECVVTKLATEEVRAMHPNKTVNENGEVVLVNIKVRDCFGERALLTEELRAATVTTIVPTTCLKIDSESFKLLMGPLEDILAQKIDGYDQVNDHYDDDDTDNQMEDIPFDSLKHVGMLGQGSFGLVRLVKYKATGETYALKGVSKEQIVFNGQQDHIMSEKRVMMRFNHPLLVRLYCTYNKKELLYFLFSPILGGELFTLLRQKHMFEEDSARFYAGCVVLAFEYMHAKGTIYRDLKPENLLVDADGYVLITDFGFAKRVGNDKTWTLCGTPDYLCPEIVNNSGHNKGADWWTLGVLIYEMLSGKTPFYAYDQMKMFNLIIEANFNWPSHFSSDAKLIIQGLCQRKPTKRLGVVRQIIEGKAVGGAHLIKLHPWWNGMEWDKLYARQLQAPHTPKIGSNTDLRNFEQIEPEMPMGRYYDDGSGWDKDF